jgi:hypothetical protein
MIQQIAFEQMRHDIPGIFYQFDIPWLRFLNIFLPMVIFVIIVLGVSWCFQQYLLHRNDPVYFEEFSNMGRWNLPCL